MTITENHLASGVRYVPVLKTHAAMRVRRFLVIHNTSGASGQSSIDFWKNGADASAHFVIERDGTIIQCVPCNIQAWHAGKSAWTDANTGVRYYGLNSCSIGIELANAGNAEGALKWARKQPGFASIQAKHKHGGPVVEWEAYPEAQLEACNQLSKALIARYNLDDLLGHDDASPGRKTDPGPAFPMTSFRRRLGFLDLLP